MLQEHLLIGSHLETSTWRNSRQQETPAIRSRVASPVLSKDINPAQMLIWKIRCFKKGIFLPTAKLYWFGTHFHGFRWSSSSTVKICLGLSLSRLFPPSMCANLFPSQSRSRTTLFSATWETCFLDNTSTSNGLFRTKLCQQICSIWSGALWNSLQLTHVIWKNPPWTN